MLTRRVRIQLFIFAIIAVVATGIAALYYAQIPKLLGYGRYEMTATFNDASGLYPNALVTQNGVDIGLVNSISLTDSGAKVVMRIDNDRHIPQDAEASIHSTSAIGEQYVDFTSTTDHGPYLAAGFDVPATRTNSLPSSAGLLDSVDELLKSIPNGALRRVLDSVDTAFGGSGDDLRRLVTSAASLLHTATDNIKPTIRLLQVAQPFLTTQLALTSTTTRYVNNLVSFTDQLVTSRSDIAAILNRTKGFTDQSNGLTGDLTPTLPTLLANITTIGGVFRTYLPNLQQTLVLLPPTVSVVKSALIDPQAKKLNSGNLFFKSNVLNPKPCTTGYIPASQRRPPQDVSLAPTPKGLYCNVPADSQQAVRGSRNAPCAGLPGVRAASPALCDAKVGRKSQINAPGSDQIPASVADGNSPTAGYVPAGSRASSTTATQASTRQSTVPYEPATGRFQAPDGKFYVLGAGSAPGTKAPKTWQQLLLAPVGR